MGFPSGNYLATVNATRSDGATAEDSVTISINAVLLDFVPVTTYSIVSSLPFSIRVDITINPVFGSGLVSAIIPNIDAPLEITINPVFGSGLVSAIIPNIDAPLEITINPVFGSGLVRAAIPTIVGAPSIIVSTTSVNRNGVLTITLSGEDLTTFSVVSATYGGIDLGAASNITPTTVDFAVMAAGLQPGINHNLIVGTLI
jgi:hypothetical protein